jgi:hypothetical protein
MILIVTLPAPFRMAGGKQDFKGGARRPPAASTRQDPERGRHAAFDGLARASAEGPAAEER